ncbi:MAG: HDIG domain-containing protein [Proteobacteria bacterium]|nr:HDIG domain-containing protein [Pseudomonadota bacterium]MBU1741671.1 HDIG domain-containing protein [Pseudomonadota bacterium]
MNVPDQKTSERLLAEAGVPDHIVAHSALVARLALTLGRALNRHGRRFDLDLVRAGGLLHDIAKMDGLENGANHALVGHERLTALGYPEIGDICLTHVVIDPDAPLSEAHLINYADKRVRHQQVVSLDRRFEDLAERYGQGDADRLARMHQNLLRSKRLEQKIFALLPFEPQDLEAESRPWPS